jgi:phenylalanyl-tRNA synthetase beta chain
MAMFGEVHPRIIRHYGLKGAVMALTVLVETPPQPKARKTARGALSGNRLQSVERDFAFVLDAGVEAAQVVNAAMGADKALIADVQVFDEFAGDKAAAQLGEGRKSLAIAVRLQPGARTLTDEEIDAVGEKLVAKVTKATGGTLRG